MPFIKGQTKPNTGRTRFAKGSTPWNKGKELSLENREKISLSLKGRKVWNKGKKLSDEHKEKLSLAHKGKRPWRVGKPLLKNQGEGNPNFGKFGKDHPRYKEIKVNPFLKSVRETYKYRQWRSDNFTRDDFACIFCGKRGCELNVDHYPMRFIDIINEYKIDTIEKALACEKLLDINNGRTLCVDCHRKTDTWGNKLRTK